MCAYVDGSGLDDVVAPLEERLVALAAAPGWLASRPIVVPEENRVQRRTGLPDWDLGFNVALLDPGDQLDGWFGDVELIAAHLAKLHSTFDRDFVIGIADNVTGLAEDLFFADLAASETRQAAQRRRRS